MNDAVNDITRILISGEPTVLRPLLDILAADAEVAIISVARASTEPERLVVAIDRDRAAALQVALGSRVTIEPDDVNQVHPI